MPLIGLIPNEVHDCPHDQRQENYDSTDLASGDESWTGSQQGNYKNQRPKLRQRS